MTRRRPDNGLYTRIKATGQSKAEKKPVREIIEEELRDMVKPLPHELLLLADQIEVVAEQLEMHTVQRNRLKEAAKALRQLSGADSLKWPEVR